MFGWLCRGGVAALMLAPAIAQAGVPAYAVTDVNLRFGPGMMFHPITAIPGGTAVTVLSCLQDGSWCETSWGPVVGWVYSRYLTAYAVTPAPAPAPMISALPRPVEARDLWPLAAPNLFAEAAPMIDLGAALVPATPEPKPEPVEAKPDGVAPAAPEPAPAPTPKPKA